MISRQCRRLSVIVSLTVLSLSNSFAQEISSTVSQGSPGHIGDSLKQLQDEIERASHSGVQPLPLNEYDWNKVTLAKIDDNARLSTINAETYKVNIAFDDNVAESTANIRDLITTGSESEERTEDFDEQTAIAALDVSDELNQTTDENPQLSSSISSIFFDEAYLAENVIATRERAIELPLRERYEFLKSWVLPSEFHSAIRMNGAFTQTDPAPIAINEQLQNSPQGGELVSPVFDLLEVANKLGKLEELRQLILDIPAQSGSLQQRAQVAMLILVNLEIGDQVEVSKAAIDLYQLIAPISPTTLYEMWPETLVVYRDAQYTEPNPDIAELLSSIYSQRTEKSVPSGLAEWHAHISSLMLQHRFEQEIHEDSSADTFDLPGNWIPVGRTLARTRGRGMPHADWSWNGETVFHRSSHDNDFLFFQSPIKGDFEIEGDVLGYGVIQILAGGKFFGTKYSPVQLETGTFRTGPSSQNVNPPLARFDPWVHFRVVFRDGVCKKYINGRLVLTEELSEHDSPWIGFRSWYKRFGGFRNLQITGSPEVPDIVNLSESTALTGWLAYFEESIGDEHNRWSQVIDPENGNQIIGRHSASLSGTFYESLLRYHRPLVEDGSIDYDFYYEPGKTLTHPALDRMAFMLAPDGVRIHWITDGSFDQTDVEADNLQEEPQNQRGPADLPFKENQWNHMKLRTAGKTVSLELNGQLIFERELEKTNRRTFGLFHYGGATEIRVRNVVMQADWPKLIPPTSEQKLTDPLLVQLNAERANLKAVYSHDFTSEGLPSEFFKTTDSDKRGSVQSRTGKDLETGGIAMTRPAKGSWASTDLRLPFHVYGDYDIEASFDALRFEGDKDTCIMLVTHMNDDQQHMCRNIRILTQHQRQQLHSSLSRLHKDGTRSYGTSGQTSCEAKAGRLRLARRGDKVYYLFAENDSRVYRIFSEETATDQPILPDGVRLRALCNGVGEVQVNWKDITVRAERLTYLPGNASVEPKSLYTMNSDGSELRLVTKVPEGFIQFGSPEWSSDNQQIAFDASNGGTGSSHVMVINADGTNLRDLGMGCMPSFSADGERIVFSSPRQGIVMMNSDGSEREVIDRSGWGVQWSPDGKYIAYGKSGNITLLNVDTRESRLLFLGEQATRINYVYWNLGWSHDSRSICAKVRNRQTGLEELIVADIDSPDGFKVLHSGLKGINPDFTWGPENKNVLFAMNNPSHKGPQLFLSNRANPAAPKLFPAQPLDQKIFDCAWSPDGKQIVFSGQKFPQAIEWPPVVSK